MSLRHTLLVLLEAEAGSGYDIAKKFQESIGYFWHASHQQIYQELSRLNDRGLVEFEAIAQQGKPDKKIYSITDKGRDELVAWLKQPLGVQKVRDDLMVKLAAAHMVEPDVFRAQLQSMRQQVERDLEVFGSLRKVYFQFNPRDEIRSRLMYAALKRGIIILEGWCHWADEVIDILDEFEERYQTDQPVNQQVPSVLSNPDQ